MSLIPLIGILGMSQACETIPSWQLQGNDNPDPGKRCHFPFIWSGVTHNECVKDSGGPWCSTQVNRRGEYIDRKWGVCSNECPVSPRYGSVCKPSGNTFSCFLTQTNGGGSSKAGCATIYSDNYYGGRSETVPKTNSFNPRNGIKSIKVEDKCEIQLYQGNEKAAIIAANTRDFRDLSYVTYVSCSCYRTERPNMKVAHWEVLCEDGSPAENCDEGKRYAVTQVSNGRRVVDRNGTPRVDYQERLGRYTQDCYWKKTRGNIWRCLKVRRNSG